MKVWAIILNYRTPALTIQAIDAAKVALARLPGSHLCVVDNASGDGSSEMITAHLAPTAATSVSFVQSPVNGGFGAGNNLGIKSALEAPVPPDYIFILNSDAFPEPDAIKVLSDHLDAHPRAGIAGSQIWGTDGRFHETAFRFPTVWSEIESGIGLGLVTRLLKEYQVPILPPPKVTQRVDWLAGASMMVRTQMVKEIGAFDETFFLYFEETDLCRRAHLAGWETHYVVESRVAHVGSATTGMKKWERIPQYWLDSRHYYFRKHYGSRYQRMADIALAMSSGVFQLRRLIQPSKQDHRPPKFWHDFVRHSFIKGDN